jgi:transposase
MPEKQFITGIPGVKIHDIFQAEQSIVLKGEVLRTAEDLCPHCQGRELRIQATTLRQLKHAFWEGKLVSLHLKVPKLFCRRCHRYFVLPIPGVLPKRRSTERFRQEVFELHHGGLTQKHLSRTHRIGTATVERWYQSFVAYRVKELEGRRCPIVLGIDEHFFTRKDGFATTLVDLRNHKVFDVVLGRTEASLGAYLERLPGREKVAVVVMDLSETYRRIVQKYFPNAQIVADRFHVIGWINHQFLKTWGDFDPDAKKSRGLLSLMRRHPWNLKPEQKQSLDRYLDEQMPAMRAIYEFKTGLVELLLKKHQNQKQAKDLIPQLLWHIEECRKSPLPRFQELARTLKHWLEPIARMWRFTKNNGITEGLHTKMEMISRRAFGFRNFKNYRLRVIALCGWDGLFNRTHSTAARACPT